MEYDVVESINNYAPAHNALSVKQFLANKNITVLEHPPYSPDLAPCDFFPKIKSVLKGTHFVSVENVKAKNGGNPQQPYIA
jgi:transposase